MPVMIRAAYRSKAHGKQPGTGRQEPFRLPPRRPVRPFPFRGSWLVGRKEETRAGVR